MPDYVPHTDDDRGAMLAAIGVAELEDLFDDVPERFRFPELDLPAAVSESEVEREMLELARANADMTRYACFLGAGTYRHFVPATVDAVLRRGEFFTSYTPYQPELSQGLLQATFEYQTMICALTGMDVSTASHYDGATALAEAVLLALSVGGPSRRAVVAPARPPAVPRRAAHLSRRTAATLTGDEDPRPIRATSSDCRCRAGRRARRIRGPEPELLRPARAGAGAGRTGARRRRAADRRHRPDRARAVRSPGGDGADVVVAEGQSLGLPASFGGPHLGILATRREHVRRTAGGSSARRVDAHGRARLRADAEHPRAAHPAREGDEQHLHERRADGAGRRRLPRDPRAVAACAGSPSSASTRSHYAAAQIGAIPGCSVNPQAPGQPFFKEFVDGCPSRWPRSNRCCDATSGSSAATTSGATIPASDHDMLVAVTEMNPRADIDRLVRRVAQHRSRRRRGRDAAMSEPTLYELSVPGRRAVSLPRARRARARSCPTSCVRDDNGLPELSQLDVVRHYQAARPANFGVDSGFYPLGSCTMKYNPKVNEEIARLAGFAQTHPLQDRRDRAGRTWR